MSDENEKGRLTLRGWARDWAPVATIFGLLGAIIIGALLFISPKVDKLETKIDTVKDLVYTNNNSDIIARSLLTDRIARLEGQIASSLTGEVRDIAIRFSGPHPTETQGLVANNATQPKGSECSGRPQVLERWGKDENYTYRCYVDIEPPLRRNLPSAILIGQGGGRDDRLVLRPIEYNSGRLLILVRYAAAPPGYDQVVWSFEGKVVFLYE